MFLLKLKDWVNRKVPSCWCALGLSTILLSSSVFATNNDKALRFHGITKDNNANASEITSLTKDNVADVQLYGIYNIPDADPSVGPRHEKGIGYGVAITPQGLLYTNTINGVIHVLDITKVDPSSPNADGTKIPKIVAQWDLLADPQYTGESNSDGDDIYVNRIHPSISNNLLFAGNYNDGFQPLAALIPGAANVYGVGVPNLGFQPKSQGAVLYAINRKTGALKWKTLIDDNPHAMITNSPVVHEGVVYVALSSNISGHMAECLNLFGFGCLIDFTYPSPYNASGDTFLAPGDPVEKSGIMYRNSLVALKLGTGEILWKTYVMPEQNYVSPDEVLALGDLALWNGGSSWGGGNFPIDKKRKQIYIGTGESYGAPVAANECEAAENEGIPPFVQVFREKCIDFNQDGTRIDLDNNEDDNDPTTWNGEEEIKNITNVPSGVPGVTSVSHPVPTGIIAFDYQTGDVKWARRLAGFDVWNASCFEPLFDPPGLVTNFATLCPSHIRVNPFLTAFSKDLDVAEMPMLIKDVVMEDGQKRDILYATTKASLIIALDPDTGETIWGPIQPFGPGSLFGGGILWGSATDGQTAYVTSTTGGLNINNLPDTVVPDSCPASAFDEDGNLNGGIYGAVNLADGTVKWQRCMLGQLIDENPTILDNQGVPVPNPNYLKPLDDENGDPVMVAGWTEGPVLYANGMVIVPGPTRVSGGGEIDGQFVAEYVVLDAESGEIIKDAQNNEVRLPLHVPGDQSASRIQYQRAAAFGNALILTNGTRVFGDDERARRVVIYTLGDKVILNEGDSNSIQADPNNDSDPRY